jgi:hypothetical protein
VELGLVNTSGFQLELGGWNPSQWNWMVKTYSLQNAVELGGQQQHPFSVELSVNTVVFCCFAVEFGRSSIVS